MGDNLNGLIPKIEALKRKLNAEGSVKYDWIYDEIIDIIEYQAQSTLMLLDMCGDENAAYVLANFVGERSGLHN